MTRTPKKRKKTKKQKGLGAVTAKARTANRKLDAKTAMNEILPILLTAGGLVAANFAGKALDKMLKAEESGDKINFKKLAAPLVLTIGGVAVKLFLKDQNAKSIADGIVIGGLLKGVKVILKKDLLNGMEGLGETENSMNYRRIPVEISIDRHQTYKPDLPALESADLEEVAGLLEAPQEEPQAQWTEVSGTESDTIELSGDEIEIL